jgi:hypothetical protein
MSKKFILSTRTSGREPCPRAALSAARIAAHKEGGQGGSGAGLSAKERGLIHAVGAFFAVDKRRGLRSATDVTSDAVVEDGEGAQLGAHLRYLAAMKAAAEDVCGEGGKEGVTGFKEERKGGSGEVGQRQQPKLPQCRNPDDPDILALLAEAHMNLTPWKYWRVTSPNSPAADNLAAGTGHPPALVAVAEGAHTVAAFDALTRALAVEPGHPLAAHLMVHLTESLPPSDGGDPAGEGEGTEGIGVTDGGDGGGAADVAWLQWRLSTQQGGRGLTAALGTPAADRLRSLSSVAGQSPHLVHMAAHNYVRVGRWQDAVAVSKAAVAADSQLSSNCLSPYGQTHNAAMLVAAAVMNGDEAVALAHAMDPGPTYPGGLLDEFALVTTGFHQPPKMLIFARFGRWGKIKDLAVEAEKAVVSTAGATAPTAAAATDAIATASAKISDAGDGNSGATMRTAADADALTDVATDITTAKGWTSAVSNTAWGRIVWAYSVGLAAAAGWDEEGSVVSVDGESVAVVFQIPASNWLSHLRQLAAQIPEDDSVTEIPGLSTRGSNPFARTSPFWPVKRQLAAIMTHTLAARVAVGTVKRHSTEEASSAIVKTSSGRGAQSAGGIAQAARDWGTAVRELELAVAAYDALPYFEPEHWYLPVRHCLGEALLQGGEPARAVEEFQRDLR